MTDPVSQDVHRIESACLPPRPQVADDYYKMGESLKDLANNDSCGGRILTVMEGGYCCVPPKAKTKAKPDDERAAGPDEEDLGDCIEALCRGLMGTENCFSYKTVKTA
jgi:hypothetical protein